MERPAIVSLFLDPRYKSMTFLSEDQKKAAIAYTEYLIPDIKESMQVKEEPQEDGASGESKQSNILDCLVGDVEIDLITPTAINAELEQYITEPIRIVDPLEWWRANENRY